MDLEYLALQSIIRYGGLSLAGYASVGARIKELEDVLGEGMLEEEWGNGYAMLCRMVVVLRGTSFVMGVPSDAHSAQSMWIDLARQTLEKYGHLYSEEPFPESEACDLQNSEGHPGVYKLIQLTIIRLGFASKTSPEVKRFHPGPFLHGTPCVVDGIPWLRLSEWSQRELDITGHDGKYLWACMDATAFNIGVGKIMELERIGDP